MIYCFDLDGTLCTLETDDKNKFKYQEAKPIQDRIDAVNELYDMGHTIIIETARGSTSKKDWYDGTKEQLCGWGLRYHKLRTGIKIPADVYVDDRANNSEDFFRPGWPKGEH